jgi:hypothetical protein
VIRPADSEATLRLALARIAPVIVIALVGFGVRTPIAAAYPSIALFLALWIVSDTMMLSLIARSPERPAWHAVLGVLAGASVTVWLGSPPALRAVVRASPVVAASMAALVLGHVVWAAVRAKRVLSGHDERADGRWIAAAAEFLPRDLIRLAAAEWSVLHMALFRWGGPADVPADARRFSYHRHLTPMCAALLILSSIEMAVYHLLVAHWSRSVMIVMFVVSDLGFVYLLGLIKSFRFRPVLLTPEGVIIRAGFVIDETVPLEAITCVETAFSGDAVRDPATLNAALLAWPNILVRLDRPMQRRAFLRSPRSYSAIAFRLDDPEPFVRLLRWRLGQAAA